MLLCMHNTLEDEPLTPKYFLLTDVCISGLRGRNKSWASGQATSLGIVAADTTSQSHTMSVWFKEDFHI